MSSSPPGTFRCGSVSSIRSSIQSPRRRFATALSALPTCRDPVGLGAKRTLFISAPVYEPRPEHPHDDGRDHDQAPRNRHARLEHVRDLPARPSTLDDLLDPEVVRDVADAVAEHEREVGREEVAQPAAAHIRQPPREQQRRQHEQDAFQPVGLAVMDGGSEARQPGSRRQVLPALKEVSDERDAVRVETEIGREPGDRQEEQNGREGNTHPVGSSQWAPRNTPSTRDVERQHERQQDAERRQGVEQARVEVRLANDTGPDDNGAEERGHDNEAPMRHPLVEHGQDGNSRERDREVDENECAAQPSFDPAPRHVVQLRRRQPAVCDDHFYRDDREQGPHDQNLEWQSDPVFVDRHCLTPRLGYGFVENLLLEWFAEHARQLPWRGTRDPYAILVSEVMLQQTQVERVVPRYRVWLERWPTVEALAGAPAADVIVAWQGLGYNRRGLNLHRAARQVAADGWPDDLTELPGVGPYTAAALGNFAFGRAVLPVDTNVRRVQQRTGHSFSPRAAQALMDLGATVCLARVPRCGVCPLALHCPSRGQRYEPQRKQSRFEGSFRQRRARTLRLVADGERALADLDGEAVRSLARDGLVRVERDVVALPR